MSSARKKTPQKIYLGKYIVPAILLTVCTLSVLSWYWGREKRDEILIRSLIGELAEDLSKTPQESTTQSLLKVKNIADAFNSPADIVMDIYAAGSFDSEQLFNHATRYRTMLQTASVSVDNINITVIDENNASGYFSGSFSGTTKNGLSDRIVKDIEVDLIKVNNKWKIKSLKFSNVLR